MNNLKRLRLRQTERRLARLRKVNLETPERGWLRTIRESLGMSTAQLGRRLGVAKQTVSALERREQDGAVTLQALREAAAALNSELVYAIVPKQPLPQMLEEQALAKALRELGRVSQSMRLEAQTVDDAEASEQLKERVSQLVHTWPRSLWDPPS